MSTLDLGPFNFARTVEVHGVTEECRLDSNRLVFLFGEDHGDREMKRLNVLNACRLVDARVVGCAGTEIEMYDMLCRSQEFIQSQSEQLFEKHSTDDGVLNYLMRAQSEWFGFFDFAKSLKLLRPALPVDWVEDPELYQAMKPIKSAYDRWSLMGGECPFPGYPNMGEHPINFKRERAMVENLLKLWECPPHLAAILNTGSYHIPRITSMLNERNISTIRIILPASHDV